MVFAQILQSELSIKKNGGSESEINKLLISAFSIFPGIVIRNRWAHIHQECRSPQKGAASKCTWSLVLFL